MLGLASLELSDSIFNITEENNKFELYKFPDEKIGAVSYTEVRHEIEKDLGIADIAAADLQDDILAPINNKQYREQITKRMKDGKYMYILWGYSSSLFQEFECFLRTEVDFVQDDNK